MVTRVTPVDGQRQCLLSPFALTTAFAVPHSAHCQVPLLTK